MSLDKTNTYIYLYITITSNCGCVQLELLLKYYGDDVRRVVKLSVLVDMRYLAKQAPHLWTSELILVQSCCHYYITLHYRLIYNYNQVELLSISL